MILQSATTLLFVTPSTSARVVSHQLSDKVALFSALRKLVSELENNNFDCLTLAPIDIDKVPDPDELPHVVPVDFGGGGEGDITGDRRPVEQ